METTFILDDITIVPGDCFLFEYPVSTFDCIITDPPYEMPGEQFSQWWTRVEPAVKADANVVIFGWPESVITWWPYIDGKQWNKRVLIWHYKNKNLPGTRFQRSHETVIWLSRGDSYFDLDSARVPYTDKSGPKRSGKSRPASSRTTTGLKSASIRTYHPNGALPRDVIEIPACSGSIAKRECRYLEGRDQCKHPNQKPEAIIEYFMKCLSRPGNFILDTFGGSGTTASVGYRLGRKVLSIEKNTLWASMAYDRLLEMAVNTQKETQNGQEG